MHATMDFVSIHRDVLKQVHRVNAGGQSVKVALYSRVPATVTVFCARDEVSRAVQTAARTRLELMLRDAQALNLFSNVAETGALPQSIVSPHTGISYTFVGHHVNEILVGHADLSSANFAALDLALASMSEGEVSWFAASKNLGYCGNRGDVLFRVEVTDVYLEEDLTAPTREITKHVVKRDKQAFVDPYGYSHPVPGAIVDCTVIEVHSFSEKTTARQRLQVEVNGVEHDAWLHTALKHMTRGELATVRVASTGSLFKVHLSNFQNLEPPRNVESLVARVEDLKNRGNELYARADPRCASRYVAAVYWLKSWNGAATAEEKKKLLDLEVALEGNLAQHYLNAKIFPAALQHANSAVELDPQRHKNIFRRAKAKRGLKRYQEAIVDLNRAQLVMEDLGIPSTAPEWRDLEEQRTELEFETS